MTSLCITLVVASLFLSIYASAASAPIHKTTVWVAPETETLINGIPESQTPMVTDVIMGPYFYRYDYNQKTTVDKYRHIAHFSHDNRLNKLSEQMEAQITNSASQGAEWSGNVEFTAEIKKKIIESLKGTLGISYKETRTTNEAVGYKVVHTVPAGKVGHINLYYKGYKIGGRLTVWTANTSNPSQSKRYATYDVNSTLYPSNTLDIFSESYNANI